MKLSAAIKKLRSLTGESQQVFATGVGATTRSLQMYEQGSRLPEPRTLFRLALRSEAFDNGELYNLFMESAQEQLTPPPGYEISVDFRRSDPSQAKRLPYVSDEILAELIRERPHLIPDDVLAARRKRSRK